jgi:putative oxidoreductase
MTDLKLLIDERRSTMSIVVSWLPRIVVALVFFAVGIDKFATRSVWVEIFASIGIGQWFRYVTGVLQAGGAILFLIPRTFLLGVAVLSCTMVGAIVALVFVLDEPRNASVPGILLIVLLAVGVMDRWSKRMTP